MDYFWNLVVMFLEYDYSVDLLVKLCENVLGMKIMKTDEFGHMIAHSCLGMPKI